MPATILIVDDDPKIVEVIRLYLQREGFQVLVAYDGLTALSVARQQQPDLVILDWLLPQLDGLDVCRVFHAEARLPIIMLTAKAAEDDLLLGLKEGADDYLVKPFRPRELVARVRALLRRVAPDEQQGAALHAGELTLNPQAHEARLRGEVLALTPTEFKLLETLMRTPGRAWSRGELVRRALGLDYEGLERTIDVHLMHLRKKIEAQPDAPRYVQTVYGVGYKFAPGDEP